MTYTHGLEKIYAFETINPATVRSVARSDKAQVNPKNPYTSTCRTTSLRLPFGPYFEEGLPSFKLREPIASLELTPFALKALTAKQIKTVEEAYTFIIDEENQKHLGPSLIVEIAQKIESFVGKYPKANRGRVDFKSLITILCHELDPKGRFLLFARFGLRGIAQVTSTEFQEINRLNPEQIEAKILQAKSELLQRHGAFLETALQQIQEAFILPWLRFRHGFCKREEGVQRLQNISVEPDQFANMLALLQELAPDFLSETIITSNQGVLEQYEMVIGVAKGYFYKPESRYPVVKLVSLIERDLAYNGVAIERDFIERVLKCAPSFSCFFDTSHTLFVHYNLLPCPFSFFSCKI